MEEDQNLAERRHEVRCAARTWQRAGLIGESTRDAILELYPDDRNRVGPAFRVLLFLFAAIAVVSAVVLLALLEPPTGLVLVLTAAACIAATEIQVGTYDRTQSGAEEATACLSVVFVAATYVYFVSESGFDDGFTWRSGLLVVAVASVLSVFRWGVAALGAVAAASVFFMLAWWPGARIAWILLALALAPALLRGSVSPKLAPSHRTSCDFALVVVLLALYVSFHLGSYDIGLVETELFYGTTARPYGALRALFIAATAVLPVALLALGIWWRRPLLLRSGIVFSVASLVTLRFYVHVAPLWVVLTVSGGAAVAVAMLVHRLLEKERNGFTAERMFERLSPAAVLEIGAAAALAPAPTEREIGDGFRGGGGEFGGGGATGSY